MHTPVLLHEVIKFLEPHSGEFFIDGTVDGGGHAAEIFEKINPDGILLGIDWDERMIEIAKEKISANSKFKNQSFNKFRIGLEQGRMGQKSKLILVHGNYADLPEILKKLRREVGIPTGASGVPKADGLLLDLGFSSEQLEVSGRGFSFMKNEPLLMTYDSSRKSVKEIIRDESEESLAKMIFELSGERFSRQIARAIKERGKKKPIETTGELIEAIIQAVPRNYERGRIDPATRTFQALRIYANDELGNLERVLKNLPEILKSGGRAVIITFHSLEDRIVKINFREMKKQNILNILTKKPISPSADETRENPRSRSAKLRAAVIS